MVEQLAKASPEVVQSLLSSASSSSTQSASADPDPLLETCGRLADAIHDRWSGGPPPPVYRARTTPGGRSLVFTQTASPLVVLARRLQEATALHAHLMLRAGFTVPDAWLG